MQPVTVGADQFERLLLAGTRFIDVRAEIEFARGAIPGAVNLPILRTAEREQVGTCYKRHGQEAAIALGHRLVVGRGHDARGRVEGTQGGGQMSNWRDALPSQWLKAADFEKPGLLTIRKFSVEQMGDDKRPVVWFDEVEKGLGLNITNGNTIEEITGSADPARWVGHKVVLYKTQTDFKGTRTDCIRIRATKPGSVAKPAAPVQDFHAADDDVPF